MVTDAPWSAPDIRKSLPLTLALPKGRLFDRLQTFLGDCGLPAPFEGRKLVAEDARGRLKIIQVKNSDLPVYVHHGIAGLGICGGDVIYESGHGFFKLLRLPFGSTRMCLAGRAGSESAAGAPAAGDAPAPTAASKGNRPLTARASWPKPGVGDSPPLPGRLQVATKYVRFTRDYFMRRGIPVEVIALDGSVELAPVLGLAPFIVDLVETGSTLAANNLTIIEELETIDVYFIANPAYYKLYYRAINLLLDMLTIGENGAQRL